MWLANKNQCSCNFYHFLNHWWHEGLWASTHWRRTIEWDGAWRQLKFVFYFINIIMQTTLLKHCNSAPAPHTHYGTMFDRAQRWGRYFIDFLGWPSFWNKLRIVGMIFAFFKISWIFLPKLLHTLNLSFYLVCIIPWHTDTHDTRGHSLMWLPHYCTRAQLGCERV